MHVGAVGRMALCLNSNRIHCPYCSRSKSNGIEIAEFVCLTSGTTADDQMSKNFLLHLSS